MHIHVNDALKHAFTPYDDTITNYQKHNFYLVENFTLKKIIILVYPNYNHQSNKMIIFFIFLKKWKKILIME